MTAVEIRPAEVADAPAIQRIARAGWHAAYDDVFGPDVVDEYVDDWYAPETLEDPITDPGVGYFVAEADDGTAECAGDGSDSGGTAEPSIVGYASCGPAEDEYPDDCGGLYSIYVDPERWGEGIGSALLDRAETFLEERGHDRLRVVVLAANDVGTSFYRSHGYERKKRRVDEFGGSEHAEYVFGGDL
ncbi:GNAT family N-acetyltransferase [Haloarchaeobius sp. HRN-SO-5]|uniref:GNAT family N-acetyltransferase n=1 Tax=Haloarchaeobius sp. HRN-SO-5 TaxID=3446118 RepID=UPI003EBA9BEE